MFPTSFLQRYMAVLSALFLSQVDSYWVELISLIPTDNYISVREGRTIVGDVAYGRNFENGRLPEFPCGLLRAIPQYHPHPININIGYPLQVYLAGFPTSLGNVSPDDKLGEWSVDIFWGHFWGAPFDSDHNRYSWFRAMDRKFRIAADGARWCRNGEAVPVPSSVKEFGGGTDTSVPLDVTDLEGVNATLAVRFNYFDPNRGPSHANYFRPDQRLDLLFFCSVLEH